MPSQPLLKRDWQKDHVYLVQFPRAGCIPSPSPFALKLETWLRMANVEYSNISNEFTKMSTKGQIPFIELNGRQIADSQHIIEFLGEHFQKEAYTKLSSPLDQANALAYLALLENHLFWALVYQRSQDNAWMATEKGFLNHFTGIKKFVFQKVILGQFKKKIDCAVFAVVAQLIYTPIHSEEIKKHVETNCPRLVSLVTRVKQQYWPDWDEATSKLSLDTKWKPE